MLTGKRKLNYVIPDKPALGSVPSGAEYLVFTEDLILPNGWTAKTTDAGVLVKDRKGKKIYLYENPVSTDEKEKLSREKNTLFETSLNAQVLTIKTKVKVSWLLDAERVYPVKVDPTASVYPNNTTRWSISVYNDGDENEVIGYFGYTAGYWLRYFIKFDTSTIPSGSTISAVTGYIYQYGMAGTRNSASQWVWGNSADPTSTFGTTLYQSSNTYISTAVNTQTTNGWKNSVFDAAGLNYAKNGIDNLGYISAVVRTNGTNYNNNNYYGFSNHTDVTYRPYLSITYAASTPPSCATLIGPIDASTENGNMRDLVWNEVAGATSYDVYFGTSSNPPSVSSGQTGTSYTINDCLAPNTTYYWKVVPKNVNGEATGCPTWSFTTDGKIHIYKNDFETASLGFFGTSGASVDGWYTNNTNGTGGTPTSGYNSRERNICY